MNENNKKTLEQTLEVPKLRSEKNKKMSDNTPPPNGKKPKGKGDKKPRSPFFKARIVAGVLGTIAGIGVIGVIIVGIFIASAISEAPEIDVNLFDNVDSTVLLDANGEVFYDTGVKIAENISYEDIPNALIDAFLSIEDSRFFEHNGFDLPRFTMAMLTNVKESLTSLSLSFDGGGASTLDMQLVRNSLFMKENPITGETEMPASSGLDGIKRKIQEIYIATGINSNQIFNKETIFQMYVNKINFGARNNIIGIERSANYYFNKSVTELTLVESAFLAGVVNSPTNYTPYNSIEEATDRTHTVLYYMKYHGYITDDEYNRALTVPLENLFVDRTNDSVSFEYQAYIDLVLTEAAEITGENPITTPMVIHTAMNSNIQAALDKVSRREVDSLNYDSDSLLQVASSIVDNDTGEVIAVLGGYDISERLAWQRVKQTNAQPGSTIKPILDYAPAFEYLGWATSHVMTDEPYIWAGTSIAVGNWDNTFKGQVTLRNAISDSRNIPAIEAFTSVMDTIGWQKYVDYARSVGFTTFEEDDFQVQFAIGSAEFVTSPYELAGAYSTIFNGGIYTEPHTVRQVDFKDGRESIMSIYTSNQVLSEAAAYMTAQTMKWVIDDNLTYTARPTRRNYTVYGKTGTTNHGANSIGVAENSVKDLWVVTATDKFTFATWSGFDLADQVDGNDAYQTTAMQRFNLPGNVNSYILDLIAEEYGTGNPIDRPSTVADITHILGTFPYQSPIDGMDSSLITTGLIKQDRLSLVEAAPPTLSDLESATITSSGGILNTTINISMTPYPDAEALTVAPKTYTMTSSTGRTFTGTRLFDPSWLFGAVRYQADIYVNGSIQKTSMSATETFSMTLSNFISGDVKVCAYYTFEKNPDKRSNEVCQTLDFSNSEVEVPDLDTDDDVSSFISQYGIEANITYQPVSNLSSYGKIASISPDYRGQTVSISTLQSRTWNVVINDYVINANSYTNKSYNTFVNDFGQYFNIVKDGSGNTIVGFASENNAPLEGSFKISDFEGQTIRVKTN